MKTNSETSTAVENPYQTDGKKLFETITSFLPYIRNLLFEITPQNREILENYFIENPLVAFDKVTSYTKAKIDDLERLLTSYEWGTKVANQNRSDLDVLNKELKVLQTGQDITMLTYRRRLRSYPLLENLYVAQPELEFSSRTGNLQFRMGEVYQKRERKLYSELGLLNFITYGGHFFTFTSDTFKAVSKLHPALQQGLLNDLTAPTGKSLDYRFIDADSVRQGSMLLNGLVGCRTVVKNHFKANEENGSSFEQMAYSAILAKRIKDLGFDDFLSVAKIFASMQLGESHSRSLVEEIKGRTLGQFDRERKKFLRKPSAEPQEIEAERSLKQDLSEIVRVVCPRLHIELKKLRDTKNVFTIENNKVRSFGLDLLGLRKGDEVYELTDQETEDFKVGYNHMLSSLNFLTDFFGDIAPDSEIPEDFFKQISEAVYLILLLSTGINRGVIHDIRNRNTANNNASSNIIFNSKTKKLTIIDLAFVEGQNVFDKYNY